MSRPGAPCLAAQMCTHRRRCCRVLPPPAHKAIDATRALGRKSLLRFLMCPLPVAEEAHYDGGAVCACRSIAPPPSALRERPPFPSANGRDGGGVDFERLARRRCCRALDDDALCVTLKHTRAHAHLQCDLLTLTKKKRLVVSVFLFGAQLFFVSRLQANLLRRRSRTRRERPVRDFRPCVTSRKRKWIVSPICLSIA